VTAKRAPGSALSPAENTGFDLLQLAIMGFAAVAVWRVQDLFPVLNSIKVQYVAPGIALIAFVANRDPRRHIRPIDSPLLRRLLGILVMIGVSIPLSLWPGRTLSFMLNDHAKTIGLMVLIAASIRGIADIERYALMHIGGATLYSYYVNTHFQVSFRSGRLGDLIYYDANDLALLLVCTIPFCVYFLRPASRWWQKLVAIPSVGLIMYTLVQTGSRGGFLAFIACGAYLLFTFDSISKAARGYTVGILVAFLLYFGGSQYWTTMSTMLTPTQDYNWTADGGRKALWTRGIGYMLTHPLTGVGGRAYGIAEGTISSIASRQEEGIGVKWSAAHNSFIEIGAELGFIGIGLFVSALHLAFGFARRLGKLGGDARAGPLGPLGQTVGGVLIAYLVAGFFVSAGYSAYLYTIFGITLGLMKLTSGAMRPEAVPVKAKGPARGTLQRRPVVKPPTSGPRRFPVPDYPAPSHPRT
jgi:O-antigen ligase